MNTVFIEEKEEEEEHNYNQKGDKIENEKVNTSNFECNKTM